MDSPQPGSEFRIVIGELIHELEEHTKRRDEISNRFIRRHDLVKVWQNESRIHRLLYNDQLTPEDVHDIQENFIAILSILVSIEAIDSIRNFRSTFPIGTISDRDLPLEREQIEMFLPDRPALVRRFDDVQCEFCPVPIWRTRSLQSVPRKCRLPFTDPPTRLGVGGFGEVDLVAIAPRYWKVDEDADYDVAYKVACKRFKSDKDFSKEAENLRILKNSLTKQDHILQHYTTLFHDPYNYILFPYAENGDLNQLLLDGGGYYLFHERFPHVPPVGDPAVVKPLLHQCWALASAVNWLHGGIQVDTKSIMCAHLDLKPDNILIMRDNDSIVGKWMISDFGISAVEPHRDGSRPALSVGYRYRLLTIETEPKHQAGTYLPPEAIHRGAMAAAADKVGRQSDIWAYGCIFSEILAWAIGRAYLVDKLADERTYGATSDRFWEESFGQNLSPQPTGYKLRESVSAWLDEVRDSPERVLRDWAQAIKDILITDKQARPNAEKLVGYVERVCSSCDLSPEVIDDHPLTPYHTPPLSSPSSGSTETGQNPEKTSRPISHGINPGIARYLSRTARQGKVHAAVVSQDKIEIFGLNLSQDEVSLVSKMPLPPKWEDAGVVIEGQYFAAWGYCKAEKKRAVSSLLRIGDIYSDFEPSLPVNQGLLGSVAVSCRGIFALVRDKDIVLLSWPCTPASSVNRRLIIPFYMDQTFTHAIFNEAGGLLFGWARGQKQESLYVWNVEAEISDVPDFVVHYSLQRFYLNTQVIPYSSGRGCILAGDHNKFLAVSLKNPSTGLPGIERLDETIDVVASCLVGNDQLLGLVSTRGFRTRLCLRRYKIDHGGDGDTLILQDQELCNINIPREFKSTGLMRAYQEEGAITVVLWNGTSILISKGIKEI
ncbi:kinase-like protein [Aspergillus sclerotioniger CBS 115572]|uniref:Kinase-like protein n=1 Tax=Aspergillus sclerotioniger CBS 115572 TaxID=1450535 RepID=A0A317WZH6_9EURO|nr:kinase-like protein [Aspergillus sclerotioniger CBS 115572]PWY91786.1 kinase-like protein [Aspergillus sclerotioniger CBS 115572]